MLPITLLLLLLRQLLPRCLYVKPAGKQRGVWEKHLQAFTWMCEG